MENSLPPAFAPTPYLLPSASEGRFNMQSLFEMAFECSCEAKMICDSDNLILVVNRAFTEMTGYSVEEVVGKTSLMLSSGQIQREHHEEMWRSLGNVGRWSGEFAVKNKDGSSSPRFLSINSGSFEFRVG